MATPTSAMLEAVRRMTAEPVTNWGYLDADLTTILERYPLPDSDGLAPDAVLWAGNWDLNRAAADIWEEKAATVAADFDFAADGGDYKRSQVYAQYMGIARSFRARRASGVVQMIVEPKPLGAVRLEAWVGNLSELATEGDYG